MEICLSGGGIAANRSLASAIAHSESMLEERRISLRHVQICPQNTGRVTKQYLDELRATRGCESTLWRLHANARVHDTWPNQDAVSLTPGSEYWESLVANLKDLGQPYSMHPGIDRFGTKASTQRMLDRAAMLQDDSGVPVMLEGMYPRRDRTTGALLSTQYFGGQSMGNLEDLVSDIQARGLGFALDLSHLNILLGCEMSDSEKLAASERLIDGLLSARVLGEVHISANDGSGDTHEPIDDLDGIWWQPILSRVCSNPSGMVVFTEERI